MNLPIKRDIEKRIEDELVTTLRDKGVPIRRQVRCANGQADIVTPDTIYEIKAFLTRKNIHEACGQVLAYQVCINSSAKLFIVGCKPQGKREQKIADELARSLGIEIIVWELSAQSEQLKVM